MKAVKELISDLDALDVNISSKRGSLHIDAPKGVLSPGLRSELAERKEEIVLFLERASFSSPGRPAIVAVPRERDLPLSFAQERLWFLDKLEPGRAVYNIPLYYRLNGRLDRDAFKYSLERVFQRHEILRSCFADRNGRPVRLVKKRSRH